LENIEKCNEIEIEIGIALHFPSHRVKGEKPPYIYEI